MKFVSIGVASLGTLLMLYTAICGLWIHSHGASPAEIAYHGRFAAFSAVAVLVGVILLVIQSLKG